MPIALSQMTMPTLCWRIGLGYHTIYQMAKCFQQEYHICKGPGLFLFCARQITCRPTSVLMCFETHYTSSSRTSDLSKS